MLKKPQKQTTFKFFDYKWSRVPQWAEETDQTYRKWYLERYGYESLIGLQRFLKDKINILDAGCGLARDSKMFAELNSKAHILAVDQSSHAIKVAREALKNFKNCNVMQADITDFSYSVNFDFISCDQVLHHTPNPGETLRHLFRKLNVGGVINFSVCRKKNKFRDLADDLIMKRAAAMSPEELWEFARIVTDFGRALHNLNIGPVEFENKSYENLQRFVHNHLFRCWYDPKINFELSISSNYDWFSNNPRFNRREVQNKIIKYLSSKAYKLLRFHEDDATISVSIQKL